MFAGMGGGVRPAVFFFWFFLIAPCIKCGAFDEMVIEDFVIAQAPDEEVAEEGALVVGQRGIGFFDAVQPAGIDLQAASAQIGSAIQRVTDAEHDGTGELHGTSPPQGFVQRGDILRPSIETGGSF